MRGPNTVKSEVKTEDYVVLLIDEPVAMADKSWTRIEPKTSVVTGFISTKSGQM